VDKVRQILNDIFGSKPVSLDSVRTNRLDFRIVGWTNEGIVTSYINGTRYVHKTDAAIVKQILKIHRYQPGKALNILKERGEVISVGK
jgi:hypothetical protein